MKFSYRIEGMHCNACVEKIKSALSTHFDVIDVFLKPPLLQIEAANSPDLQELNLYISTAGKYSLHPASTSAATHVEGLKAYYPIFLIALYIIGVASINNFQGNMINWHDWMNQFMAGFFLVFSAFKLLDLHGFADGYASYDLLAKYWHGYGFIYPFLELSLGILYLTEWLPIGTQIATIIIMGFSSLGVMNSLLKKQKFQCACLGTILKVPLSKVTLIEDLLMVALATLSLMV